MKTRHILIIFSFLVLCNYSYAQEFQISGKVLSDYDLTLPGAIVENLISKEKVITNFDGAYEIAAKIGDTLKFSGSEKLKNCFEVKYRIVNNDADINLQILSVEGLKYQLCKDIPKEVYIFIGKRINSEGDNSYDECFISPNIHIIANYEIREQFYGDLNLETITFKDSDHASIEPFPYLNSKYALLFLLKDCHEYYLWDSKEILKTKEGDWALAYHPDNYSRFKGISSQLQTIPFNKNVKFKGTYQPNKLYSEFFNEPYYVQKGKYLKPLMGNYVKDYVRLWMENSDEFKNLNVKED
jgi:hypothetical protein